MGSEGWRDSASHSQGDSDDLQRPYRCGAQAGRRAGAYRGQNPLVLAIPRGAVPMARRWPRPSVASSTWCWCTSCVRAGAPNTRSAPSTRAAVLRIRPLRGRRGWLKAERARRLQRPARAPGAVFPEHPPIDPHGRVVIIVNDSLATGATMIAALQAVRAKPAKAICAVPGRRPTACRSSPWRTRWCLHALVLPGGRAVLRAFRPGRGRRGGRLPAGLSRQGNGPRRRTRAAEAPGAAPEDAETPGLAGSAPHRPRQPAADSLGPKNGSAREPVCVKPGTTVDRLPQLQEPHETLLIVPSRVGSG